jgi:hypothetical protein
MASTNRFTPYCVPIEQITAAKTEKKISPCATGRLAI